jgi:hypothetical protein
VWRETAWRSGVLKRAALNLNGDTAGSSAAICGIGIGWVASPAAFATAGCCVQSVSGQSGAVRVGVIAVCGFGLHMGQCFMAGMVAVAMLPEDILEAGSPAQFAP